VYLARIEASGEAKSLLQHQAAVLGILRSAAIHQFKVPMYKYPAHVDIDFSSFAPDNSDPSTRYGLPKDIKFCTKCVISNQRPNSSVEFKHTKQSRKETISLDEDGVCDACRVAEEKHTTIDWTSREEELIALCDKHRSTDGSYDCLLPGSGGKDSFYAAHILKTKYGMHPLTVTWAPHIHTDWGWKNFESWIHAGFDNYLCTPNGKVHRLLTRLSVENLYHPFQPFILGQKNLAPKLAERFNIPLVFYGENEAEYGNPKTDVVTPIRSNTYYASKDFDNIYLGGVSLTELQQDFGLEEQDFIPYMPADPDRLEKVGIQVHYLGYYLKWHPQSAYYYSVEHGGFQASPERTPGTYSKYNSIDDKIDDLHYFCTHVKFGIGRATYDAAQEIRSQDILREEGVALAKRFDGEYPDRFEADNFAYMSITEDQFPVAAKNFESQKMTRDYFLHLADRFRSPHLWQRSETGEWSLRRTVWQQN
tara:strand:+ start:497 stop:1930 length:1434 start_codon:yes stop_codon:yes gene_type:complete